MSDYADALDWLMSLPDWEREPGARESRESLYLERPAALLDALGRPQARFRSILVAGTKGKGSTAAMLESILRAAGYKTGFYSQPHLHTYRERIRVNGELISPQAFAEKIIRLQSLVSSLSLTRPDLESFTTFEVTTALALEHFAYSDVEIAVLEVGLGGRLDATNIVDAELSLITSISYDHTAILGNTLAQIAREKGGIIKSGKPILTAMQPSEALSELEHLANERNAPLGLAGRDWIWLGQHDTFMVAGSPRAGLWSETWRHFDLHVPLRGMHQLENAALAVAAAEVLRQDWRLEIRDSELYCGLVATEWSGRIEVLQERDEEHPLIIADGAHNGDSAGKLVAALRFHFQFERLWLVLAVLSDKHLDAIAAPFVGLAAHAWTVRTRHPRSRRADLLAAELGQFGIRAEPTVNTAAAIESARASASARDLICITGSLSVVPEAREVMGFATVDDLAVRIRD